MPIGQYLNSHKFDDETARVVGLAFVITRSALGLIDRNEPAEQVIAAKLIELAQQGERDPDRLAYRVLAIIDAASLAQSDPSPRGKAKGHE